MSRLWGNETVITTRYNGLRVTQAILGQTIPLLWGTRRLSAKLLWYGDFHSSVATNGGKKGGGSGGGGQAGGGKSGKATGGGGKKGQMYVYSASIVAALCMGDCESLLSVWDTTGKYVTQSVITETFTVPPGGGTYTIAGTTPELVNADQGVAKQSAYSQTVNDFGSPGPVTLAGTQGIPFDKVVGSPGTGQYSFDPTTATYTFAAGDAGAQIVVAYAAWRWFLAEEELNVVPFSGPFEIVVENQPYFEQDLGVRYYPSGNALTPVSGLPLTAGTYNPNGGNYLFAPGDAGQGIVINYSFTTPLANQDLNAPNQLNLTFFSGATGQAPWSYLVGRHPAQALGYTQVCYIASSALYLGFAPVLPEYNYEISGPQTFGGGILDACPSDCIEDIITSPSLGLGVPVSFLDSSLQGLARAFWLANNFFISPLLEGRQTCASVIGQWLEAGQVGTFWSEGVMKFIPYGTASAIANGEQYTPPTRPLASLNDSDFIVEKDEDPVKFSRSPWQDAYNQVRVQWSPRINDYYSDVCLEQDDAAIARYGLRPEGSRNYDFICTLPAAQFAANMRLQRFVNIRNTYDFRVNHSWAWLDPMDIIEITDTILGLNAAAVRILKIVDDPAKGLQLTVEDFPWASGAPSLYVKQAVAPSGLPQPGDQLPGDTSLVLIETPNPSSLTQGSILSMFATGLSSQWGGCVLSRALGTNSCQITSIQIVADVLTVFGTNNLSVNDQVTFFDVDAASFLNGQKVTVVSASGSQFTASFAHADYANTADTGSAWAMTAFAPLGAVSTSRIAELAASDEVSPPAPALPAYVGSNPDPDHFYVDLLSPGATLEGISQAANDGPFPVTLAAIITNGVAELVTYQNAELWPGSAQPGARYRLDTINRGLFGTSAVAHDVGDIFVRMDDASAQYQYDPTLYGKTVFIAAQSFNLLGQQQQSLTDAVIYKIQLEGTEYVGGSAAHLSYVPFSNPLTAHDLGSVPEIIVAPFDLIVPGLQPISINGGTIVLGSGNYNELFYVYYDDPALQGGTVVFNATTSKSQALEGLGRIFVGSIITPRAGAPDTTGNGDGGAGAQVGAITVIHLKLNSVVSLNGNGTLTGQGLETDGDMTTSATFACSAGGGVFNGGSYTLVPIVGITERWSSVTLKVRHRVSTNNLAPPSAFLGNIAYELQIGTLAPLTLTPIFTLLSGSTLIEQTFSYALPTDLNLTNFYVEIDWGSQSDQTSGALSGDIFEVWLEAIQ